MFEKIMLIVVTSLIVLGMALPVAIGHFADESKKKEGDESDYED